MVKYLIKRLDKPRMMLQGLGIDAKKEASKG